MTRNRYDEGIDTTARPAIPRRALRTLRPAALDTVRPWVAAASRALRPRAGVLARRARRSPVTDTQGRRLVPRGMFQRRGLVLVLVYAIVLLITVGQLVRIQVLDAADYAERSADQRERFLSLPADRGRLYDRGGDVLAASVAGVAVVADPSAFQPSTDAAGERLEAAEPVGPAIDALTSVLDLDRSWLRDRLSVDGDFVFLARQLDPAVGERVMALDLDGISLRSEPRRTYPGGAIGSQVLGITDIDGGGVAGMELVHDRLLAGQPGWLDYERSRDGRVITVGSREVQAPTAGTDVVLTLDRQLQFTAEQVAAGLVDRYDAVGASIVVLEVGTGDVLAMASAPTADLGDRRSIDADTLRNRAVTDVFEPGSVQKAITAAAAIEAGVVTPDTVLEVPDTIQVGDTRFSDSHSHPTEELTFAEVMEESSNVGTIQVAQELGPEALSQWLVEFGFGRPTEVGFPAEAPGLLRPVEEWWDTSLPTIAIGQGIAVTLLQQANAYATIANDGVALQPRLVRGTVDEDGLLQPTAAIPGRRVLSPETARQVRTMLSEVVDGDRGTGAGAAIDGYEVAGKTGTARKPREDGRGYSGAYVANFTGMAPADDPEVVVAVMVDEPSTIWGGVVAAPAFAEVAAEALRRQRVAPATSSRTVDEDLDRARAAQRHEAARRERARARAEAAAARDR